MQYTCSKCEMVFSSRLVQMGGDGAFHTCGRCKTHHRFNAGSFRPASPAELFQLHLHCPEMMQYVNSLPADRQEVCIGGPIPEMPPVAASATPTQGS